jgi:hypothetical protein
MTFLLFITGFSICLASFAPSLSADASGDEAKKRIEALEKQLEMLNRKMALMDERLNKVDERSLSFTELDISGFFDVSFSNYKNQPNVFKMGIFELDLEHSYDNRFQVAAALVFDEDEGTRLGVGFIDYAIVGGPVPPRGRLFIERGFHIQVGRFDVPIGNDWNYVSSVKRYTVTPPLTTTSLMEGTYNDVGLRMFFNLVSLNFSLYSTQGIEQKHSYGGISYGTRIGFTPLNNPYTVNRDFIPSFELGYSYLYDLDDSGEKSEDISAVDFESNTGLLLLRSEYYKRVKQAGVELQGYHITSGLDFEAVNWIPLVCILRYDVHEEKNNVIASYDQAATGDSDQVDALSRITLAIRFNISDTSFLKFEFQEYQQASERFEEDSLFSRHLYYAQLVITF